MVSYARLVLSLLPAMVMMIWVVKHADHSHELGNKIDLSLTAAQSAHDDLSTKGHLEEVLDFTDTLELRTQQARNELRSFTESVTSLVALLDEEDDSPERLSVIHDSIRRLPNLRKIILKDDFYSLDFGWRVAFVLLIFIILLLNPRKEGEENHPEAIL